MKILNEYKVLFESLLDTYADYPKKGVSFKDLSRVYSSPEAMQIIEYLIRTNLEYNYPDCVIGCDARGFILGTIVARVLEIPFVLARKPGKLPGKVISKNYELEYGTATIEMHEHIISKYKSPVIADDLLATGGTVLAVTDILERMGIEVNSYIFLAEVEVCGGRNKLEKYTKNIYSVLKT